MRRRAVAGLTVCSFILSIAIGGLWLRSYAQLDLITHREENQQQFREYMLAASQGRVMCSYIYCLNDPQSPPPAVTELEGDWKWRVDDPVYVRSGESLANHHGFTLLAGTEYTPATEEARGATWTKYGLMVPWWFLFTLSLILPALSWHRGRRQATQDPQTPPG